MSGTVGSDALPNVNKTGGRYNGNGNGKGSSRNSPSSTPLLNFVNAKVKINLMFGGIEAYVDEVVNYLKALSMSREFVEKSQVDASDRLRQTIHTIREVLNRDHMKVVFFGRTSNGKSTCINAMLHSKVLPAGMGHTTRCFVQVEASPTGNKYVLSEDSDEPKSIDSITQLSHALLSKELGEDTMVRVLWPKMDSKLLKNEVVLVDSPGIDLSPQFDEWIDKHCLDADVFVLVSNAESTLTQTEKNFFHRVNEKVSSPNIFILNNRWDASAAEPEYTEQVRAQHMSRFVKFLTEELHVCSLEAAKHRIFFVSAREMLMNRLKDSGVSSPSGFHLAEGYQSRLMEFEDFERQFELCISHSAIQTKFAAHIEKGKLVLQNLHHVLEMLHNAVSSERKCNAAKHEALFEQLKLTQKQLQQYLYDTRDKIQQLSAEVQLKVSSDLTDEVRRLDAIMDKFQRPFADDPRGLDMYKRELTEYIDQMLVENLKSRCGGAMLQRILMLENEMLTKMCSLLPPQYADGVNRLVQYRRPFEFAFAFNCVSLMDDFQEDLEFRFSLGLTSLIRRFTQLRSSSGTSNVFGAASIPRSISIPDISDAASDAAHEDMLMKSIVFSSASYVANGGVGLLIVGGIVYRTLGWRVIAVVGSVYGLLYMYERYSWNDRAKERQFRDQFRRHLSRRLRQLSATVTMNCDQQVTREVHDFLSRLQGVATDAQNEMKREVDLLHKDVTELEKITGEVEKTKGKATYFKSELDSANDMIVAKG